MSIPGAEARATAKLGLRDKLSCCQGTRCFSSRVEGQLVGLRWLPGGEGSEVGRVGLGYNSLLKPTDFYKRALCQQGRCFSSVLPFCSLFLLPHS